MNDQPALITDLDGTIYNWANFFVPSFRSMVESLVEATRLDEDTIVESFRRVYLKHKTVEYLYDIEELDIWQYLGWKEEEIYNRGVKPARDAFREARESHLRLYPHVKDTLRWIKKEGILLIAYTDAPLPQVEKRLKILQIDHFFFELCSWKPDYVKGNGFRWKRSCDDGDRYTRVKTKFSVSIDDAKPNPKIIGSILNRHNLSPQNTYLIGDSILKDISAAQQMGLTDIWVKYGQLVKEENIDLLRRITPWTNQDIERSKEARRVIQPTLVIDDFAELKHIIPSRRPIQLGMFP